MPDTDRWLLPLLAAAVCAAAMAVMVTGVALVLGTTGHDWYAAWKLTLAEAMLFVGFDDYGVVNYRTADGETVSVERYRFAYRMLEPWRARGLILSLIADRAVLGACTGLAAYVLWLGAHGAAEISRRLRGRPPRPVVEPAPRFRPGRRGPGQHPDTWSENELVAALAKRSSKFAVLLMPGEEAERLTGCHRDAVAAAPANALPAPPARALLPPDTAELVGGKAGETGKAALADPENRPGTTREDNATGGKAGSRGPGQNFY